SPEANKLSTSAETQPPIADQKDRNAPGQKSSRVIATPPISIFPFNKPHLPAIGEFYGRVRERITLIDRTRKEASTSIVGPRRIDEFEGFFNHQDFDCEFYANLRYIASNGLVLVIASKDPLIELVGERCKTSGFFNIFHQLTLKPFDKEEAEEYVQAKSKEAG